MIRECSVEALNCSPHRTYIFPSYNKEPVPTKSDQKSYPQLSVPPTAVNTSINVYIQFASAAACWRPLLTNLYYPQYSGLVGIVWRRYFYFDKAVQNDRKTTFSRRLADCTDHHGKREGHTGYMTPG